MSKNQSSSMQQLPLNMNIVLLGKTGSGKSTSGNTILGREAFKAEFSPKSVTRSCQLIEKKVDGQIISVIDTVGLPDTVKRIAEVQTVIEEIFDYTHHGVDVFLLVIKLGQTFTQESRGVVKWIQENFGAQFSNHTIVLFTYGDQLHVPIEEYISKCEKLHSVVNQCSGGFHVFNNSNTDQPQVTELLKKINRLRVMNGYKRYKKQDYKKAQDEILQRRCINGAAVGGGAGAVGGAAGVAVAAKVGAVALTAGKATIIGATGGAALVALAACAGVYWFTRKYKSKQNSFDHEELRKYACDLTLDPNTAHTRLILFEDNRKVAHMEEEQSYPDHPERFENCHQVLCRERLTGRCYWEVKWRGREVEIAVTYKGINRKGGSRDCWFGYNDKSWSLYWSDNEFSVWHNNVSNNIQVPSSSSKRIGVYLDCLANTLSFYSVSDTQTLTHLHTFNTTFTEPLYAGFRVYDASVSLCKIGPAVRNT